MSYIKDLIPVDLFGRPTRLAFADVCFYLDLLYSSKARVLDEISDGVDYF